MSADVNASEIMQNMIMNDDDKEWYALLFKKMHKDFLKPRFTVNQATPGKQGLRAEPGMDQGLNCSIEPIEGLTDGILDTIGHVTLDLVGLIPGLGEAADATNALWYAKQGDYLFAALSLISVIPELGDAIGKGGKVAVALKKAGPYVKKAKILIKANSGLINKIMGVAEKNEKLGKYVPKMKKAILAFAGERMHESLKAFIRLHLSEQLVTEPDDTERKRKKKKKKKTDEFNSVGSGNIAGYTLPLGASNQSKKARKKNAGVNARAFGGGNVVGKL